MNSETYKKQNLIMYPLGTVGRDMIYSLFTNFNLLFILYTRNLTNAQLGAITAIMVAARVFDAFNDPLMGNIIERTRTKYGKFKPWLTAGILSTSIVVYLEFNSSLEGWSFIWFFGLTYFLFSITFTMNDISYWGMVPALSTDGDTRNVFTSRATLFAGIGGTLASILIPLFTTGAYALGGSAKTAYGRLALVICILAPLFCAFTIFGVHENREDASKPVPPVSFKKIVGTILGNDQLVWISIILLIQQVGNGIAIGGAASNYIYFEFGYEGGLYSIFTTIGMAATAFLMVFYPTISRRFTRKQMVRIMGGAAVAGYIVQLLAGIVMPSSMIKFWVITIGFMFANLGQYGLYLIMMISIINTVEYNELMHGTRDEAIITSMRPYLTKMGSALVVLITSLTYMIFRVTEFTNQISNLENTAERGIITATEKSQQIAEVLAGVQSLQTFGLLLAITVLPCVLMVISCVLYNKHYTLDEDRYDEICEQLKQRA